MPYVDPEVVRLALAPSSDSTRLHGGGGGLTDQQMADCIAQAQSQIDLYLGGQYVVPVAPDVSTGFAPSPVDFWCRDLAAYYATLVIRGSNAIQATEPIYLRYLEIMRNLAAVQAGKALVYGLPRVPTDDPGVSGLVGVVVSGPDLHMGAGWGAPYPYPYPTGQKVISWYPEYP